MEAVFECLVDSTPQLEIIGIPFVPHLIFVSQCLVEISQWVLFEIEM